MAEEKTEEGNLEAFFSNERKQRVIEWLEARWTKRDCECCGSQNWSLSQDIVAPNAFNGQVTLGGTVYPHVIAICGTCGNSKFFNVAIMNIFPAPTSSKEKKNGEGENG